MMMFGKYQVLGILGTGSCGVVYKCVREDLEDFPIALKILYEDLASDEQAVAKLRSEFSALLGLSHMNVITAYEYLRDEEFVAYSMEYAAGGDLAVRLERGGLPMPETVRVLADVCSGIQAVHSAGYVHRNIKPENILFTKDDEVRVSDFCIAAPTQTMAEMASASVSGTIQYVSPEFVQSGQLDHRADIYSLGMLAYEMITGQVPFRGNSVQETMTMRLTDVPKAMRTLNPSCATSLESIVMRAMDRDPKARFQSADEMRDELLSSMLLH